MKNNKEPFVSVIIPCRRIDNYTLQSVKGCLSIDYDNYEILVLPDELGEDDLKAVKNKRVKIIPTGKVKPAVKRNLAMKKSRAGIYAFIDSDAYPERNWLRNAVRHLHDEKIGLVGGPNLTPKEAGFREKVSGIILSKWIAAGRTAIRYKLAPEQQAIELPSCNFIVRKEYASEFDSSFLTAEDSKFCFNVWRKGGRVLYSPDVIVYHHRREVFKPHARQMWIYARDIAILLKRKGQFTMDKLYYSILSLFVLGVLGVGIASLFFPVLRMLYFLGLSCYLILVFLNSLAKDLRTSLFVFLGIILTHFSYGIGFIYGLFSKPKNQLNLR